MPKIEKVNMGEHFRSFARVDNAYHLYKKLGSYNASELETKRLKEKAKELIPHISARLDQIRLEFGDDAVKQLDEEVVNISYPLEEFPTKISSHNFDKNPEVSGILKGIKGIVYVCHSLNQPKSSQKIGKVSFLLTM